MSEAHDAFATGIALLLAPAACVETPSRYGLGPRLRQGCRLARTVPCRARAYFQSRRRCTGTLQVNHTGYLSIELR